MKKSLVVALILFTAAAYAQKDSITSNPPPAAHAQKDSTAHKPQKKDWSKVLLGNRSADHLMFQFAYDNWSGKPDSIHTVGFSRSFNMYFMFDFPFKTDPRVSVGAGLGVGWSNIFFDKQEVEVASANNPTLAFPDESGGNHFKKYKLVTGYLDMPLELRFAFDPEHMNSSWKLALGAKVGVLLSAYTKGKNLENNANQPINNYVLNEGSNKYFNGTRLAGTFRVNYGVFGIFAQYQITPIIKGGSGPNIYPYAIGILISGL
jgi:Outer membrane protein beta-barrel domain